MHDFDDSDAAARRKSKQNGVSERRAVGFFHTLSPAEQEAAVLAGTQMRADARVEARADLAEQQEYLRHKREQASERQMTKLVA
eukprot:2671122-Pleurochrysis_carterae.AAC.1